MEANRMEYGRCSFILPNHYEVDEQASPILDEIPESMLCLDDPREPVTLTISRILEHEEPEEYNEFSEELDMEAFPLSISVTTLTSQFNDDPLEYLQKADAALEESLEGYDVQFCKNDRVGDYPAASGQSSFVSNFLIYRLSIAWLYDAELIVAAILTPENFIEKSWTDLRGFAESLKFIS